VPIAIEALTVLNSFQESAVVKVFCMFRVFGLVLLVC
jgi:hypothetical protein